MEHSKQLKLAELLKSVQIMPNLPTEAQSVVLECIGLIYEDIDYFKITSLHRADLRSKGFLIAGVTDEVMERLAFKMANDYCEQLFNTSLEIIAEILDIPKVVDVLDRLVGMCKDVSSETIDADERTKCEAFIEFIGENVDFDDVNSLMKSDADKFIHLLDGVKQVASNYQDPTTVVEYSGLADSILSYVNTYK